MKINELKLNHISKADLEKREMNKLTGGNCCGCGCNGPSSLQDNKVANYDNNYTKSYGGNIACGCTTGPWKGEF